MAEELNIAQGSKEERYKALLPQIAELISSEDNLIANLANISAALNQTFSFLWVGFYLVENDELVLGPFQGPIACTRIRKGKGVCGAAWERNETLVVADVEAFPGHIACSAASRSEIVVPIARHNQVLGLLDVDSEALAYFDEVDRLYLEKIVALIGF